MHEAACCGNGMGHCDRPVGPNQLSWEGFVGLLLVKGGRSRIAIAGQHVQNLHEFTALSLWLLPAAYPCVVLPCRLHMTVMLTSRPGGWSWARHAAGCSRLGGNGMQSCTPSSAAGPC